MSLFGRFRTYKRLYKNYIKVIILISIKSKEKINVILKNGCKKNWDARTLISYNYLSNNSAISNINLNEQFIEFDYNGTRIKFDSSELGDVAEVFGLETYKPLIDGLKDYIVVDIGANIGDSAIYFAANGAKRVIALEPYPYSFNFALNNVKMNHLDDKISLLNAGYGAGSVLIDPQFENKVGNPILKFDNGTKINLHSLADIIGQFDLKKFVLKIDCEGCEYYLDKEAEEVFEHIFRIQAEYHYGLGNLLETLSRFDYTVNFTKPRKNNNYDALNNNMTVGWLYAIKSE